jgi:tetratricopeptide (TPR) repeat protein
MLISGFLLGSCASNKNRPVTDVKENARSIEKLAIEHWARGDIESAAGFFQKALIEDQKVNNLSGITADLYNIAKCYVALGRFFNAEKVLEEARSVSERSGNESALGDIHLLLAQIRARENRDAEASVLLDRSIAHYREAKNDVGIANAYNTMGSLALKRAEYDKALARFEDAVSLNKKKKNRAGLAAAYNNMGYLFELQKRESEAAQYYLLALDEDTFLENSLGISSDLHNLARLYKSTGAFEDSLFYYKRALDTNRALSLVDRVRRDLDAIIDILGTMGRNDEKEIYEKALAELG